MDGQDIRSVCSVADYEANMIDIREDESYQEYLVRRDQDLAEILRSDKMHTKEVVHQAMVDAEDAYILNEVTKKMNRGMTPFDVWEKNEG